MNKTSVKYEQAMKELNHLVQRMQSSDLGVDELSEAVKRALTLIKICRKKLQNTEIEIKNVIEDFDQELLGDKQQGEKGHERE